MTKRKQSPSPATQQMAQLEEQFKLRAVQRAQKLLEMQSATDFWLTSYVDVLDRYREGNQVIYPLSNPQDRRAGSNFPFWTSESQLAIIRASSRLMVTMNPSAYGLINGLTSYVIGSGYTYRATAIEGSGVKGSLVRAVQRAIDNFIEENSWKEMEQELFFRSREDGEAFLRFFPQDSGNLQVRTMEPEQVIQPPDSTFDEWSYGIQTDIDDVFEIKAYYAHYSAPGGVSMLRDGVYGEIIPADQVVHIKCNVKRAIKRGLPDLSFDTLETFSQGSKLRRNMGEGAAVQSAIAAVRQHDTASSSQVETFAQSAIDYSMQLPFGGRQQDYSRIDAGSFLDIPKGMNYIPPPGAINASAHLSIYEALLRAAGTRHNAPEWLVSGDASNNNYASSLTAESPFLRNCQRLQSFMKRPFLRVITEAVKNAIDAGRLPKDTLKLVEIVATAPTVETRNRGEEASANQVYSGLGVKSRQTIAQEIGLDWEREAKEIEAYNERFGKDGEGPEKGKAPPDKTPPKGGSPDKEKLAPESITEDDGYAMDVMEDENCGIGSGGFKKGNKCAKKKGGSKADDDADPFGSAFDDISFDPVAPTKKPAKPKPEPKPKAVKPPKPVAPPKPVTPPTPPAPTPPPAPPKPVAPPAPPPKPKPDFTPKRADHPEDAEVFAINKNYPAHKKMTNDMLDSLGRANAVTAHKRHISGDNTITFYDGAKDVSHKILPVHEYTGGGGIGGHLETLAQILSGDILRTVADQYRPNSPGYRVGDPHEEVKDFMYRHVKQGGLTNQDEVMIGLGLKADRKTGDLKTPNIEAFLSTGSMKEMKRRFDHSITMTPQSISAELENKYGPSVLGELGIGNGNHQELATAHAFMGINEELAESAHPVSYELAQKFPQLAKKSVEALMKPMTEKFAKSQHLVKDLSPFSKKQIGELKTEQDWEALKKSTSDPVIRKKLNDDFSSVFNRANLEKMAWERHGVNFDFSSTAIPDAFEKMKAITDELKAKARDHIKAQYTTPTTVDEVYRRSDHSKKLLDVQVGDKIDTGGSGGLNLKVDLKPTPGYKKLTSEAANFIDSISEIPVHDVVMFNRADALMNGMNPNDRSKEVRAFANSRVGALGSLASRSLTDTDEAWKAFRPAVFTPESKVIEKEYHSEKEWAEHYSKSTMIHELGHIIEGNDKYVTDMAQMFLAHRLKGEKPVRMKDVVPHSSYGDSEMGRKDNFDKTFDLNQAYYIGKDYGKHASEVLAMGLQQLYNNPKNFLENDPEYAHFVISVLQYKTAHESLRKEGK